MRHLPFKAQIFLLATMVCGLLALLPVYYVEVPRTHAPTWELIAYGILGIVAGGRKIQLFRSKSENDVGSMSLGFTIGYAAMLRCGPAGGMLVHGLCCLSACLYPKRQKVHQLLFNVALTTAEACAGSFVFLLLNGGKLDLHPSGSALAILVSCITYFLVNTLGVASIISLCSNRRVIDVWRANFMWTFPTYLTGACASSLALMVFADYVGTVLWFALPPVYLTYKFYAVNVARTEEKQQHIEELQLSQEQLAELYLATIKSLALAIDAKDQYTHQHILRVQRYSMAIAERMNLSESDLEGLRTGALLHDIGKLGVPEYVLLKPGRLTDEEFAKVRKHPEIGAAILDPVEFPWPVKPVVLYHHEKWDGTGYPEKLKGEDIPLLARILAVADVYDALTSARSYRSAWSHEKTKALIKKDSGTHFDPEIAGIFLEVIDGVVEEMAAEGYGPLVQTDDQRADVRDKSAEAARAIQRASSELWALYEVAETLSSSLGLEDTVAILARKLEAILTGVGCVFMLKSLDGDHLEARAAVGPNQEYFLGSRTIGNRSASLRVLESGKTHLGAYDPDDVMINSLESGAWCPIGQTLIVPITHQGEKLGTINVYYLEGATAHDADVHLLEMIAERAAMALYNGLLFDRTRSEALTDPLTGLHNVRSLTQAVDGLCDAGLARMAGTGKMRQSDAFALLCLDLDSFKPINDNFGHQKGDEVLKDLAGVFQDRARTGDIVARYGGDEFLIVLRDARQDQAAAMAERLVQAVEEYDPGLVHPRLGTLRLGVSVGYACFPDEGTDCAALLSVADARMYRHKSERKLGNLRREGAAADTVPLEQRIRRAA